MKTFKQHVREGSDKTAASVGSTTTDSVEDGSIGVHNIHDADVLKRVNAFVGSIGDQEYIKPQGGSRFFKRETSKNWFNCIWLYIRRWQR